MMRLINKADMLPLKDVKIHDDFWSYYINLIKDVVVPYQWQALNDKVLDAEPSRAIKNLKIAAGKEEGEFYGMVFQDSDIAKWLEAVGYLLLCERNPDLERIADEVIDLLAQAQQEDGYLNTYYIVKEPGQRWSNLCECHELYCAGHLIEGAIAYFKATGKQKILDIVIRFADYIDEIFGNDPAKIHGYDGHQEIELALLKLYEITEEEKYLNLSKYFLDVRGIEQKPHFYDSELEKRNGKIHFHQWMVDNKHYSQAHQPILKQEDAVGHAVRAVYMYTGMAHLAALTSNEALYASCKKLWNSIVSKQLYITGSIGTQSYGEAFSFDYDLPSDTAYAETCASIGLIFFAQRMLEIEADVQYADVIERALYNTVLGGMSRDGRSFFYVNPLEVYPEACEKNENYKHVKPIRQKWFDCACCPPNIARLISSLGQYLYTVREKTIYANLYISGTSTFKIDKKEFILEQNSSYPWQEKIQFDVQTNQDVEFNLALRIPSWCDDIKIKINEAIYPIKDSIQNGYVFIKRSWKNKDQIELLLSLPILPMKSHPLVRQNAGKVAIQRGPIVYCLEEVDNGKSLYQLELMLSSGFEIIQDSSFIENLQVMFGKAVKTKETNWIDTLYKKHGKIENEIVTVKLIPYFAWANRGLGEMQIWTRFVE